MATPAFSSSPDIPTVPAPVTPALDDIATTSTLAVLCFILGGVSLALNPFVISFYSSKIRTVVPALYVSLATSDLITGISSILCGMYLAIKLADLGGDSSRVQLILSVFFIASLSIRASAVYTPILSVVRSINIARPFDRIPYKGVMCLVAIVPVVWTVILGLDVWTIAKIADTARSSNETDILLEDSMLENCFFVASGGTIFIEHYFSDGDSWYAVTFLLNMLPFLLPSFLSAICMIHQIVTLATNKTPGPASNANVKRQNQITVSIALLTTTFFICNSLSVISSIFSILSYAGTPSHMKLPNFILIYILPYINSAANPFILILRGAALRTWVTESVKNKAFSRLNLPAPMSMKTMSSTTSLAAKKISSTAQPSLAAKRISSTAQPALAAKKISSTAESSLAAKKISSTAQPSLAAKKISSTAESSLAAKKISSTAQLALAAKKISSTAESSLAAKKISSTAQPSLAAKKISSTAESSLAAKKISSTAQLALAAKKISSTAESSRSGG